MGLQEKAIVEAAEFEVKEFQIDYEGLPSEVFSSLLHVFSHIGIFVDNQTLKDGLLRKLAQQLEL